MFAVEYIEFRPSTITPNLPVFHRRVYTFKDGRQYGHFMRGVRKVMQSAQFNTGTTIITRRLTWMDKSLNERAGK